MAVSPRAGGASYILICSHFPLQKKLWAQKISLDPKLHCLGGGVIWVKSYCFSYPLQCVQTCSFLFQWCPGTSLLENWTSTKALISMSDCLRHIFPGVPRLWPRGAGATSLTKQGPEPGLKSVCLSLDALVGKLCLGHLAYCAGCQSSHFCVWMEPNCCRKDILFRHDADTTSLQCYIFVL